MKYDDGSERSSVLRFVSGRIDELARGTRIAVQTPSPRGCGVKGVRRGEAEENASL